MPRKKIKVKRRSRKIDPAISANATIPEMIHPPVITQPGRASHRFHFFCLVAGWALVFVFFLGLQQFHPIYNPSPGLPPQNWWYLLPLFFTGLLLMAWSFKKIPVAGLEDDTGKWLSRFLLLLILGLAAFIRLYQANSVPGHYWNDFALPLNDASQISDYHQFFVGAPFEEGEPLYAYSLAVVMRFFPSLDGIFIQRLVLVFYDLAAILVFYALGREFGKRRIGLLMASFGAISKAMLMIMLSYMRFGTIHVAIALVLLFSLRLYKKPSLAHFLQWAVAIGLGFYTYTAFRPMAAFFVFTMFFWILYRKKEEFFYFRDRFFGWGLMGLVALLLLYEHRFSLGRNHY